MFSNQPLDVYLNDHLAGSAAALELGDRLVDETRDTELGARLAALIDDIKADRTVLEELMDRLDISHDPLKVGLGWVGEKVSRLKLAIGSGPPDLGRLLSLEALSARVQGKRSLWRDLRQIADEHPPLGAADLPGLIERAESQLAVLDELRDAVAPSALSATAQTGQA